MAALEWQDEYSVGVKELDDQHRSLLEIINTLIEKQEDSRESKTFAEDIDTLIHYAYIHFATEEQYLVEAKFPGLQEHIIEHIDFIKKTLTLALEVYKDDKKNRQDILEFLRKWYSSHVLGTDRQYIPYINTWTKK